MEDHKVMSVRGGKDYSLNADAKKYVRKSSTIISGSWFRGLFWWCASARPRKSLNKAERDIQPHKQKSKPTLKHTSNCK